MLEDIDTERFKGEPVGVLYGGTSPERPVSLETGQALAEALRSRGRDVREYDLPRDREALIEDPPAAAVLAFHGGSGEDGTIQGFLETIGIPYTGSGVLASALAIDKWRAKSVFRDVGLMTPPGARLSIPELADRPESFEWEAWLGRHDLSWPVVAKPTDGGSSQGVRMCASNAELEAAAESILESGPDGASSGMLVEERIDGEEFSVGFFEGTCLGAIQVIAAQGFYDYEAKYDSGETRYEAVERPGLMQRLDAAGDLAYRALGCRGVARVDFMARRDRGDEILYALEVNTIPGMTATSLVPKMAERRGIDYDRFAELMLCSAHLGAHEVEA